MSRVIIFLQQLDVLMELKSKVLLLHSLGEEQFPMCLLTNKALEEVMIRNTSTVLESSKS